MSIKLPRGARLIFNDAMGNATDISMGDIIDGIKQEILNDPVFAKQLAAAVAPHLTASATVRPT